jgi:transcriptional regulator PpsR
MMGGVDSAAAEALATATGDVAMIIDRDGVICDMALSNKDMARDGAEAWLDKPWNETVTVESRNKVDELLRDARQIGFTAWREINQFTPSHPSLSLRFVAVDAGREGRVIAIGRDERATALLQQRVLEAQQEMEREYSRVRDAEFRYRLLFQLSGEAVIIVDGATRRIIDANPAAVRFVGDGKPTVIGESFARIFDLESQDAAAALLTVVQSTARTESSQVRLSRGGCEFAVAASVFRHDRATQCLIRLSPADRAEAAPANATPELRTILERMPDAFVVTDQDLKILAANHAFLDLVRVGTEEQAQAQTLNQFLGRAGLDRNILVDNLRAHGSVRNFRTVLRNFYGEAEDVEVSAVAVPDGPTVTYGFSLRSGGPRQAKRAQSSPELQRSVQQLTELVGRVTLKELVRETTDLVERLCIEAALEMTDDNRASAAEVLGLSRQSLYSKLHRFGLGNLTAGES